MEILTAKTAGFCFGVERAVSLTMKTAEEGKKVYTFGPIVHNETVTEQFEKLGVSVLNSVEEKAVSGNKDESIVIRAHGITEETEKRLHDTGTAILDATCPFVKKIHRIVREHSEKGEYILIIGDIAHPEVQGICGWVHGPFSVIGSEEEVNSESVPSDFTLCVVSQTTFHHEKFKKIVDKIKDFNYNVIIADTICSATRERQEEAAEIAKTVDAMIVIGSPNSSNSRKLFDISREHCSHTYFIQSAKDLKQTWLQSVKCVGITAGASTPKNIIEEVQKHVGKF